MPLLQNHIAVVTGAGSGIGRAIANGYAREGAGVVVVDMNETAAADVAKEIRDAGGQAVSYLLDVTKRDDCVAVAKKIAEKVGPVSEAACAFMSSTTTRAPSRAKPCAIARPMPEPAPVTTAM